MYTLFEICKNYKEIYITFQLSQAAHWAENYYGLSAGQFDVLPEVKVKCKGEDIGRCSIHHKV